MPSIAKRFGVEENEIYSDGPLSAYQFINPDQILYIPDNLDATGPSEAILPDSEIVFSPSAVNFDIEEFLEDKNGEIKTYLEPHVSNWYSGVRIIERAAIDYSINPRIILSILEHQSHWVYAHPKNQAEVDYPMGWINPSRPGLSMQVDYTLRRLSKGYYDWREGSLTELEFADGSRLRMAPELNAGTAALQFLYSEIYHDPDEWENALYGYDSLQEIHAHMFENAWRRDQAYLPFLPTNLEQPIMVLPFEQNRPWNLTSGPHSSWGEQNANGALDFAPAGILKCSESEEWVTASAAGLVVRSLNGLVVVDLENDGYEQIGWAVIYVHINDKDRVPAGVYLETNDRIGHPSCKGGHSTGTHLHIARKYNGEWLLADGPVPFVLSGWRAYRGEQPYQGGITNNDQVIIASPFGVGMSEIVRKE